MKKYIGILTLIFLSGSFVLGAPKAPKWVSGKIPDYPDKDFIVGIGEGSSLNSARESARAEIAKVFETRIEQVSKETQKETILSNERVNQQQTELQTKGYTNQLLEGVNIADTWSDEKHKKFYALAVVDKRKMNTDLSTKALEQEEIIKTQLDTAKAGVLPADRIIGYSLALKAYDKKSEILHKKMIVEPVSVPDLPSGMSRAEIAKALSENMDKISFSIEEKAKENYGIKDAVAESISKLGFKSIEKNDGTNNIFMIKCGLELKSVERGNPTVKFVSWQGKAELKDGEKVLASIAPQGQVSGASDDSVKQKAVLIAKQDICKSLEKAIRSYFFGE